MTSGPLWMPLYPGDYLRDTRHLTTLQHGAYLLLIMEYWVKGRLPGTDSERRRITALSSKQWRSNRSALAALFSADWRHERIERELEKARELRLKRAVYGAKGGRMSRGRDNVERIHAGIPWRSKS
jgi:uncharacterized protein YdaU (DUF1376 family)